MAAKKRASTKKKTKKASGGKKKSPPRPKSTKNLPAGLAAYWKKKGVSG